MQITEKQKSGGGTSFEMSLGAMTDRFGRTGERRIRVSVSHSDPASTRGVWVAVSAPMVADGFESVALFTELKQCRVVPLARKTPKVLAAVTDAVRAEVAGCLDHWTPTTEIEGGLSYTLHRLRERLDRAAW